MTKEEIYEKANGIVGIEGMTGNERLYVSGLMHEFDKAKKSDKYKARTILQALKFNELTIGRTFQKIGMVDLEKQTLTKYKKKFQVLDLRSFSGINIVGFDSPIHKMKKLEFDYINEPIAKIIGIK